MVNAHLDLKYLLREEGDLGHQRLLLLRHHAVCARAVSRGVLTRGT